MKIYLGTDHRGFHLTNELVDFLKKHDFNVEDEGDEELNPNDDFPIFAKRVVVKVLASDDEDARGILLCGSGQGMCMAANRFKGIRACLGWDKEAARSSRNDDDSNVLCIPANVLEKDKKELWEIVETWLMTPFAKVPRYARRIIELDKIV